MDEELARVERDDRRARPDLDAHEPERPLDDVEAGGEGAEHGRSLPQRRGAVRTALGAVVASGGACCHRAMAPASTDPGAEPARAFAPLLRRLSVALGAWTFATLVAWAVAPFVAARGAAARNELLNPATMNAMVRLDETMRESSNSSTTFFPIENS